MSVPTGALVAVALLAWALGALLGAGEAAVLRLGRGALADVASRPGAAGRRVSRLMADPHGVATAAAWLRTSLESVAAVCVTLALVGAGWPWFPTAAVAALLVVVVALIGVRHVPRTLGRRHPAGAVLVTSPLLVVAAGLAGPSHLLRRALDEESALSDEEVREMVDRVSESEHIEDEEREMFRSVLELGDTLTRAVMVPRTEMITVPSGTPLRKALSLFLRSGYSRVPVVADSVDDPVGVLYLKDLVRRRHQDTTADDLPVDELVRPAVFVPESKPVDDLLREMQQGSSHIALVVDEYGGIAGLVTIEDALEEIVGELQDEHDRTPPELEDLGDGVYRVPSRMPLDELGELFGIVLEDEDVETAAGLLAKALGKVPLAGSSAEVAGLRLEADRTEGRRRQVSTLLVRRADMDDSDDEGETT